MRTRAYRSHRNHPALPAQWFTAYIVLTSATWLSCHRRPREAFTSPELDTSVGVSGPHDFARPHQARSSVAPSASTASPPRGRDEGRGGGIEQYLTSYGHPTTSGNGGNI